MRARDALRLLADATADGLAPRDYRATDLAERVALLDAAPSAATLQQWTLERSLHSAMHRYQPDAIEEDKFKVGK